LQFGKQTNLLFNKSDSFSSALFEIVRSNIWGRALVPIKGGSCYFVIFVDNYSRFTFSYGSL